IESRSYQLRHCSLPSSEREIRVAILARMSCAVCARRVPLWVMGLPWATDRAQRPMSASTHLRPNLHGAAICRNGPTHEVAAIGIGGSLAAPPLPHHRAYGSVHGGSRSCANTIGTRMAGRAI